VTAIFAKVLATTATATATATTVTATTYFLHHHQQ